MEFYKPIQIQHKWEIPEAHLRKLSSTSNSTQIGTSLNVGGATSLKEIPQLEYKLNISVSTELNENFERENFVKMAIVVENVDCIHVKCAYFVKSADFKTDYDMDYQDEEERTFLTLCSLNDLFDAEKKFIVDGKLTVEMKGMLFMESAEEIGKFEGRQTLGSFLWGRDDQDFTIIAGKENDTKTEIKIHKLVLAARSPVFDAMFKANMNERNEGKVEITDFDAEVVQAAVEFCYDQPIFGFTNDIDNATSLFQFCDKYDIKDLKDALERHFIIQDLCPFNICKITNAAILANSPKLREFCFGTFLIYMRQAIPVDDITLLDNDFAKELFEKAFSPDYC